MKMFVKKIALINSGIALPLMFLLTTGCVSEATYKDRSTNDYKHAKEAPELIIPSENKNDVKKERR